MRIHHILLFGVCSMLLCCRKEKGRTLPVNTELNYAAYIRHIVLNKIDTVQIQNGDNYALLKEHQLNEIKWTVKNDSLFIEPAANQTIRHITISAKKIKSINISTTTFADININQPADTISFRLNSIDSVKSYTNCQYNYTVLKNIKGTFKGESTLYNLTTNDYCIVNSKGYHSQLTYIFAWDFSSVFVNTDYFFSVISCHESKVYYWGTPQQELLSLCGNGQILKM